MKRKFSVILIALMLIIPVTANATINNAGFEGGIHKNEQDYNDVKQYKEVIFLTGQPVLLEGTVEIDIDDDDLTYEYILSNDDGTVTLEREIELERIIDDTSHSKQIVETNNIVDYDEEIVTNGQTYTLNDYQFHNSSIDDKQPVVDYYAGNWLGTKTYSVNENQGKIVVEITGEIYGYDHYWGATEGQKLHKDISYQQTTGDEPVEWFGYADVDVAFNRTKRMEYFNNLPFQTSFSSGYTLTEQEETIMSYDYNLPTFDEEGLPTISRERGNGQGKFETLPTQQKLFIPKYNDVNGHWAESDINRIAGLKITDQNQQYFGPDTPTKRIDFAKWIASAMNLVEEEKEVKRSYTKPNDDMAVFSDVSKDDPNYKYVKAIKENGIMNGDGSKLYPDKELTRGEAITIVIRALGLENLAPNLPFETKFKDDANIPVWAKKSVYVAEKLGIAEGYDGYIHANDIMTKAEAATFVNRFISYLQEDLKKDYVDNIIKYY
ncbi:MAG: S-layer homology domain-containing protein [Firmicutes bacterium]|nr:S-layer homology domain-containing protein [Bacillota bacterium]